MAVKGRSTAEILAAFERRLDNSAEREFATALAEIETIALPRLKEILPCASPATRSPPPHPCSRRSSTAGPAHVNLRRSPPAPISSRTPSPSPLFPDNPPVR